MLSMHVCVHHFPQIMSSSSILKSPGVFQGRQASKPAGKQVGKQAGKQAGIVYMVEYSLAGNHCEGLVKSLSECG